LNNKENRNYVDDQIVGKKPRGVMYSHRMAREGEGK
jgi:hypothetical protein